MKQTKTATRVHQYLYTLALAAVIFDAYYLIMKRLPAVNDTKACQIGGALTTENLIFSAVLSMLAALILAGLFRLYRLRTSLKQKVATGSLLSVGFVVGVFTVFCTVCTIPVISLFGLGIGLGFFTTYNLLFKILSLLIMGLALYRVRRQLRNHCQACKI